MQQQPFRAWRPGFAKVPNGGQAKLPAGRSIHRRAAQRHRRPRWIKLAEQLERLAPNVEIGVAAGALDNGKRGGAIIGCSTAPYASSRSASCQANGSGVSAVKIKC